MEMMRMSDAVTVRDLYAEWRAGKFDGVLMSNKTSARDGHRCCAYFDYRKSKDLTATCQCGEIFATFSDWESHAHLATISDSAMPAYCAERIGNGAWCTKLPGHAGEHASVASAAYGPVRDLNLKFVPGRRGAWWDGSKHAASQWMLARQADVVGALPTAVGVVYAADDMDSSG